MSKRSKLAAMAARLEALYAELPTIACRGLCHESCGPILLTTGEAERMRRAHPNRLALRVVARATCGYLTPRNRCGVYAVRPLICRTWGIVKRMSCPHGCTPDRWLPDEEFLRIGAAIERLAGAMLISSPAGLAPLGDGFLELADRVRAGRNIAPDEVADEAERTRGLRALHGGRIFGARGEAGAGVNWITLNRRKPADEV